MYRVGIYNPQPGFLSLSWYRSLVKDQNQHMAAVLQDMSQPSPKRALSDGALEQSLTPFHALRTDEIEHWVSDLDAKMGCANDKLDVVSDMVCRLADGQNATNVRANELVSDLSAVLVQIKEEQKTQLFRARENEAKLENREGGLLQMNLQQVQNRENVIRAGHVTGEVAGGINQLQEAHHRKWDAIRAEMAAVTTATGRSNVSEMDGVCTAKNMCDNGEGVGGQGWARERRYSAPELRHAANIPRNGRSGRKSVDSPVAQKTDLGIGKSDTAICTSIGKPPLFNADAFEGYKRNVMWWVEMRGNVADNRLLDTIGMT